MTSVGVSLFCLILLCRCCSCALWMNPPDQLALNKPVSMEQLNVEAELRQFDTLRSSDDRASLKTSQTAQSSSARDTGFYHALAASFSVILFSELGDKTWFIAAIMAMKHSRITVFAGAMAALVLMTLLSTGFGWLAQIIPGNVTFYISSALFALFGIKMLYEGYHMSPNEGQDEYNQAQAEIQKKEQQMQSSSITNLESGITTDRSSKYAVLSFISILFVEAFTLTFLAEWGDRSQMTTIILAARENIVGVILGAIAGHAFCTGLAVIGGKMVATQISVRTITLIGGVTFIIFALSAVFINQNAEIVALT